MSKDNLNFESEDEKESILKNKRKEKSSHGDDEDMGRADDESSQGSKASFVRFDTVGSSSDELMLRNRSLSSPSAMMKI